MNPISTMLSPLAQNFYDLAQQHLFPDHRIRLNASSVDWLINPKTQQIPSSPQSENKEDGVGNSIATDFINAMEELREKGAIKNYTKKVTNCPDGKCCLEFIYYC